MVPLLAAIVLGGTGTRANAATPSVSVAGVGTASPVLRQVGTAMWSTTVLVTTSPSCAQATVHYRLATRPNGALITAGVPGPAETVGGTGSGSSACEVTVTFRNMKRVPTTAALVVDDSGASASVTLTVSRDVTLASYLGTPAIAGAIAVGLYMLLLLLVTTHDWQGKKHRLFGWQRHGRLFDASWWGHPVTGSGAWTAGDSWATNISTGLVVVGAFLGATTASSSLFPGVALDRFAIVNIVAGIFVVAAPVLFAILYAYFTNRNPGPSADSAVKVPPDKHVKLRVPSGATMTMVAPTTVYERAGPSHSVDSGGSYPIAPGSVIAITPTEAAGAGKTIAFSGTSDIGVLPNTNVRIGADDEGPTDDEDPAAASTLPTSIDLTAGAKITVTGTADVNLPVGTVISGPRRGRSPCSRTDRWLLLPQGSSVLVGKMGFMVAANILTIFGIGAELGIAFVLTNFSDATDGWGDGVYAGLAVLAIFVLGYAISATRAMANPQPGSSLSAQAGTSFTL